MSTEKRSAGGDSRDAVAGEGETEQQQGDPTPTTRKESTTCIPPATWHNKGDDSGSFDCRDNCNDEDDIVLIPSPKRRLALRRFTESIYMDRFGVLSAWLFLIQTIIQLVLVLNFDAATNRLVNIVFNLDYFLIYLVFLASYACMISEQRPYAAYIGGVALYAVGYFFFFLLFVFEEVSWLYHAGSWLFLVGSVGIVVGAFRGLTGDENTCKWYDLLPHKSQAAYVFGGLCFGMGSAIFCWDASSLPYPKQAVTIGLALFVVGRMFFLYGSQTSQCNVFLCDNSSRNK